MAEEQMWRTQINFDHPDQHSNDSSGQSVQSPELADAPEEAPEEVPEEADDGLGKGADGRIRRPQNIPNYKEGGRAGLFVRIPVPPGVKRLRVPS